MNHLFVPYDIALMAKEKKFNEECCTYFLNQNLQRLDGFGLMNEDFQDDESRIAAPLYQQLIDWFREKHRIDISLDLNYKQTYVFKYSELSSKPVELFRNDDYYEAYEGAIKEAFKLIK